MSYRIVQDQSSHWYVIPVDMTALWEDWCDLDDDDPASWDVPEWADRVGGWPGLVVFEDYVIE